ncbi:hypothetical protein HELRODRAFT_173440 [Helobdella robusta]|uniref:Phosphatidate cytidylyltransferase, mitochondrial n=1 Tax=Helobdella robusta TaxID=6412 RepID=T1F6T9_HELRO|nr:hypothetical protein HELRODRAFT_173440 [Helobdella robusta]ESO03739.1 hypothetical protein HELRODRAFT_173440 [Helobdella robusta]
MSPQKFLKFFPEVRMAFAYGSGVFKQKSHLDPSKNMLDLILVTDNPHKWHKMNLKMNRKHYSFLKLLGPKIISDVQDKFGAKVYYNTLVELDGRLIKYGVISEDSLINDLFDWDTLYISGRLHKPVQQIISSPNDKLLNSALVTNIHSAMHTALLLLPGEFSEIDFYKTLAGLSYGGDFRMSLGEDKNKIENIVIPNLDKFRELYEHAMLNSGEYLHWNKTTAILEQDCSPISVCYHLNLLPKRLLFGIVNSQNYDGRHRDTEEVLRSLAHNQITYPKTVKLELEKIVRSSSWSQSAKGVLTAGLTKSFQYSGRKMKKYFKSLG